MLNQTTKLIRISKQDEEDKLRNGTGTLVTNLEKEIDFLTSEIDKLYSANKENDKQREMLKILFDNSYIEENGHPLKLFDLIRLDAF